MSSRKSVTKAIVLQMPNPVNGPHPQPPNSAALAVTNRRLTSLLPITREKIGFAFLSGSKMRCLRVGYQLSMEALEEVIREEMNVRLNRRAA